MLTKDDKMFLKAEIEIYLSLILFFIDLSLLKQKIHLRTEDNPIKEILSQKKTKIVLKSRILQCALLQIGLNYHCSDLCEVTHCQRIYN
jgi:hypothetical protein